MSKQRITLPKDMWRTPDYLYERLDQEFNFGLDAAANEENSKCGRYYISEERDAFKVDWVSDHAHKTSVFCNPPYSTSAGGLINWVERGYQQSQRFIRDVVMIVPGDTSTKYRKFAMEYASEIRDLSHRVKFVGAPGTPPWPTAIFIFRPIFRRKIGSANVSVWDYKQ